jgi:hypothetical protein
MTGLGHQKYRLPQVVQPLLAILILLGAVFAAQNAAAAANPLFTISMSATLPQIGKVSSGSVLTNFVVDTSGGISISPIGLTTTGQFIPYTSSRTSATSISITCAGNKCGNTGQTATVTITGAGTTGGRFGQIVGINALLPAGLLNPTGTTASTAGSTLTFTVNPFTGTKVIAVGMTVPVATSGTAGTATANWTATITGTTNGSTQTGNGQAQGSVEGKLSITSVTNLDYGKVFLTRDGTGAIVSGTLTWDAATHNFTAAPAGVVVQRGTGSIGKMSVSGTPGQLLHFSLTGPGLPTQLTLTSPQGLTVALTPSTTGQSSQTIPTGGTTPGVFDFYFGGTINVGPSVHTGVFGATITLTAYYE